MIAYDNIYFSPLRIRNHPPMIAVGSDDDNPSVGGKVQMQEYNDIAR